MSEDVSQSDVTQGDREAAADWFTLTNSLGIDHTGKAFEDALRDGSYDGDRHPLVQAIHAAEQRGIKEGLERAAVIAENWDIDWSRPAVHSGRLTEDISTAIRNAKDIG